MKTIIALLFLTAPVAAQDLYIPLPGGYPGHHQYDEGDRYDRPHEYHRHYGDAYEGDRPHHRHHHRYWEDQ